MIALSIEESDMSRFLKSQSAYDKKTKASKFIASVAKAQIFSSEQRTGLFKTFILITFFQEITIALSEFIRMNI